MISHLLATTSIDLGPALTQIGIGSLIATPAYVMLRVVWQKREKESVAHSEEVTALRTENSHLREAQISRERELNDKALPVLGESARVLTQVLRATEEEAMLRRVQDEIAKRDQQ